MAQKRIKDKNIKEQKCDDWSTAATGKELTSDFRRLPDILPQRNSTSSPVCWTERVNTETSARGLAPTLVPCWINEAVKRCRTPNEWIRTRSGFCQHFVPLQSVVQGSSPSVSLLTNRSINRYVRRLVIFSHSGASSRSGTLNLVARQEILEFFSGSLSARFVFTVYSHAIITCNCNFWTATPFYLTVSWQMICVRIRTHHNIFWSSILFQILQLLVELIRNTHVRCSYPNDQAKIVFPNTYCNLYSTSFKTTVKIMFSETVLQTGVCLLVISRRWLISCWRRAPSRWHQQLTESHFVCSL